MAWCRLGHEAGGGGGVMTDCGPGQADTPPPRHVLGRALPFSPSPRARGEGQVGKGAERPPKRGGVRGLRPKDWGWGFEGKECAEGRFCLTPGPRPSRA